MPLNISQAVAGNGTGAATVKELTVYSSRPDVVPFDRDSR
jgi:hypothetical protein